jgi:hypothetical protein
VHTGRGFHAVVRQFPPEVEIVLWLNEHHGEVRGADGKGFEDTPLYQEARSASPVPSAYPGSTRTPSEQTSPRCWRET